MAAMSGRLCGHYPDLATRRRGHRHSDFASIFAAARGGWLKRVFLFDQRRERSAPNTHRPWARLFSHASTSTNAYLYYGHAVCVRAAAPAGEAAAGGGAVGGKAAGGEAVGVLYLDLFAREVMPEFHEMEADHQKWKQAVLAGETQLEEIDPETLTPVSFQSTKWSDAQRTESGEA